MVKPAEGHSGRAKELATGQLEGNNDQGQQTDEGQADQESAAQGHHDQSRDAGSQQRSRLSAQGRRERIGWVLAAWNEWHSRDIPYWSHGGATPEDIVVVGSLDAGSLASLLHRVMAALGSNPADATTIIPNQLMTQRQDG